MLKVMFGFFKGIGMMPKFWWVWIGLLMVVNGVVPWFFIGTIEAKIVLLAFFFAGMLQMSLFRIKGFVRLLGIGHIPWPPLVLWLGSRLYTIDLE